MPDKNDREVLINLISNASVSADSGQPLIIHPGKADATVIWESTAEPAEHYLTVDLQSAKDVRFIHIRHSGLSVLTTSDFSLLSSSDGDSYNIIAEKKHNRETDTQFAFNNLKCRFIRLHVSKANNYECNTKIRGFQIYGL